MAALLRGLGQKFGAHQFFGDLHGVESCPLQQIVCNDPHSEAVRHRCIFADARYVGIEFASGFNGRDVSARFALVDDGDARRIAQDFAGLIR